MITYYYSCDGLTIGNQIALKNMTNHYQIFLESSNNSFNLTGMPKVIKSLEQTRGWSQLKHGLDVKLLKAKAC